MALSENGISTTKAPALFAWQFFTSPLRNRHMVQWDYRDTKGNLHTGIARTVHRARLAAQRASNETIDLTHLSGQAKTLA